MLFNSLSRFISISIITFFLVSCGGGQLSLDEAQEVTLNYQGENYTPPPRGVDAIITEIKAADESDMRKHICPSCDDLALDGVKITRVVQNLAHLAMVNHHRGNDRLALELIERAVNLTNTNEYQEYYLKSQRSAADHSYFETLHRAGVLAMNNGEYTKSIRFIKKAIEGNEAKVKPWKGKSIFQYGYLAEAAIALGDIETAEDALTEVSDLYSTLLGSPNSRVQRHLPMFKQLVLMTNGFVENAKGNLRLAENYFRQALASMESEWVSGKRGFTWRARARVGGIYLVNNLLEQGRVAEAEAQAIESIRATLPQFGYINNMTAKVLRGYINVLIARERYEDARKIIAVAQDIYKGIQSHKGSISWSKIRMSLANTYVAEGKWDQAQKVYNRLYQDLSDEPEIRKGLFATNLNWALVMAFNKQFEHASNTALRAVDRMVNLYGSNHSNTIEAKGVYALISNMQGDHQNARREFEEIIPLLANKDESQSGNSLSGLTNQRMKLVLESYLTMLAGDAKKGSKKAVNLAFYVMQLIQGKSVQNAVAASAARASISDPDLIKLVRQEQTTMQKIEAGYNALANSTREKNTTDLVITTKATIDKLVKARKAILDEINSRFPDYANLVRPKPVQLEEVSKVLNSRESLVMTYSGLKNLFTITVANDGRKHFAISKVDNTSLVRAVTYLRKALDLQISSLNEIPVFDVTQAHVIYKVVMKPSAHIWRGSKEIVVIADGVLSSLPFSTLVTEKPVQVRHSTNIPFTHYRKVEWLANRHATSYAPSVSTLVNLRQLKVKTVAKQKFAGFGNPVFGSKQVAAASTGNQITSRGAFKMNMRGLRKTNLGKNLDNQQITTSKLSSLVALPETADEVLQVAGALKVADKGNVFLGSQANESRIKTMPLNNRRVLMFATHALLPGDLDGLVQPAIALTSPTVAKGTGKDDGLLTMGEVMGLNLNADWVVLSACNTGAGSGKGATAVSGLGQAFFYAGARSLLVSHWPVETTSAKQITTGLFERQVSDKSLSRAEALNETVKDLIHLQTYKANGKDVFAYAHPVFWAPFTVIGDGAGVLN